MPPPVAAVAGSGCRARPRLPKMMRVVPPASRTSPTAMIPIRAGSSQSILIPRRASRSTPRLPSAFISTTVQSPLSTSQVNSSGSVVVTCAAQNV